MRSVQVGINPVDVKVDYINGKAYVLNRISNNISVINTTSRDPSENVTEIPSYGARISAIDVDVEKNRLFVANEKNDTVSVIDGYTHKPIGDPIPVGSTPVAITVDGDAHRLYVVNSRDDTVSVININGPAREPIGDPIPVGSTPVAIPLDSSNNRMYVVNNGDDTVSVINTTSINTTSVQQLPPLRVGSSPVAIVVDPGTGTVFVLIMGMIT